MQFLEKKSLEKILDTTTTTTATEVSCKKIQSNLVKNHNLSTDQVKKVDLIINTKRCKGCLTVKSVSEFAKNTKTDDGYLKTCFTCSRSSNTVKRSLRSAINAKCKECIYDPIAGGGAWRQQVTECTSATCSLFEVRPLSRGYDYVK